MEIGIALVVVVPQVRHEQLLIPMRLVEPFQKPRQVPMSSDANASRTGT